MYEDKFCQEILDDLCYCYNLSRIELVFDKNQLTREGVGGQYNFLINKIVIDREEPKMMEILFHEFRHYWQHVYYSDIFIWWTCHSGGLYKKYYHTPFCSIEEDARVFGESFGSDDREDLLGRYDASFLSFLRDEPGSLRQILQALGVDKMW